MPYTDSLKTDRPSVAKNYDFVSADLVTGGPMKGIMVTKKGGVHPPYFIIH